MRKAITIIILLSLVNVARSQQLDHIGFKTISVEHGLSNIFVREIVQDHKGFMWFATLDGLNMYDGHRLTVYTHNTKDSTSLSANSIRGICEDHRGNIWVATVDGLNVLDKAKGTFKRYFTQDKNSSISYRVSDVQINRDGKILASMVQELVIYDPIKNVFERYKMVNNNGKPGALLELIFIDKDHNIWLGTQTGGLKLFDLKRKQIVHFLLVSSF